MTYRTPSGRAFLMAAGYRQSATFALREHGEGQARTMARFWVHKTYYYHGLWRQRGGEGGQVVIFTPADVAAYEEPPMVPILWGSLAAGSTLERLRWLRELRPARA